jgi:hypothetical protein
MSWTKQKQDLLERFERAFGLPAIDNAAARAWTMKLAEQFNSTFPLEDWGTKRGDAGRPPSTDCICTRDPFIGYDVILNQGVAGGQRLAEYPEAIDLRGQVFIPVSAINHLGSIPDSEPSPPLTVHACPPTYGYPDENGAGKQFQARVKQAFTDAGRPFPDPNDQDAFRHFMRYGYSCRSMPEPEAADKHIAELRAQLGL